MIGSCRQGKRVHGGRVILAAARPCGRMRARDIAMRFDRDPRRRRRPPSLSTGRRTARNSRRRHARDTSDRSRIDGTIEHVRCSRRSGWFRAFACARIAIAGAKQRRISQYVDDAEARVSGQSKSCFRYRQAVDGARSGCPELPVESANGRSPVCRSVASIDNASRHLASFAVERFPDTQRIVPGRSPTTSTSQRSRRNTQGGEGRRMRPWTDACTHSAIADAGRAPAQPPAIWPRQIPSSSRREAP